MGFIAETVLILGGLAMYFLPTVVANRRHKKSENAIAMLNLLLGWTVLGWIASLVWSLTAD
jgi:hypothetical protein